MQDNQIFVFVYPKNVNYFATVQCDTTTWSTQKCPQCKTTLKQDWDNTDIDLKLYHLGRGFKPYLWNPFSLHLFREDVIKSWNLSGISGYELGNVTITGWYENSQKPLPENIPVYKSVISTSSVSLTQPPPQGEPCPICGFQRYAFPKVGSRLAAGIQVQMDTWNGNDIIAAAQYNFLLCTEKVVLSTLKAGFGDYIGFV